MTHWAHGRGPRDRWSLRDARGMGNVRDEWNVREASLAGSSRPSVLVMYLKCSLGV